MLKKGFCIFVLSLVGFSGCVDEVTITKYPASTGAMAVFDPSTSAVPTPTDLVRNPVTRRLQVPVTPVEKNPAQHDYDQFLNTLDGFPTAAVGEVRFEGELDEKSIGQGVKVFDCTDSAHVAEVSGLLFHYLVLENTPPVRSAIRIFNPANFKAHSSYCIFVVTGANGVKSKDGAPLRRPAAFELAAAPNPLCAWDEKKSIDPESKQCVEPLAGSTASPTGCCTFNYSTPLKTQLTAALHKAHPDASTEEIDDLVKQALLSTATDFERLRKGMSQLMALAAALKIEANDVALAWSFTTSSMNEAIFDISQATPVVPTPTDLVRDPKTGFLAIPDAPGASDAEKEFNKYLRGLDGFPANIPMGVPFSGELDSATLDKGISIYELNGTTLTKVTGTRAAFDPKTMKLSVTNPAGFKRQTTFVAVALASEGNGLANKDKTITSYPRRHALMQLLLSDKGVCTFDETQKACTDAKINGPFYEDPPSKPGALGTLAKATKVELMRRAFKPLVDAVVAKENVKREEIISLWSFTTTSLSEILYDPTVGVLPFPNDLLRDLTTGKVNLPAAAGESPSEKALREGLNTLDGFTTQGAYLMPVSGKINPASLKLIEGYIAVDVALTSPATNLKFEVDEQASVITATPTSPLKEKTMYGVVLISEPKEGDLTAVKGITDDKGRKVIPSTFMVLLRSKYPLIDAKSGKSLVSTLDDATAALIEKARVAHAELFDKMEALLGIKREMVAAAWVFTTQSITAPLTQLRALPWSVFAKVDNNQPKLTGTLDTTLSDFPAKNVRYDVALKKDQIGGWVAKGTYKTWMLLDEQGTGAFKPDATKGQIQDVPFMLTIPKGTMPKDGWPVVFYQHGFSETRLYALYLANKLAADGFATLSVDMVYHGDRSWCTEDAHCVAPGTCTKTTGKCTTSLKLDMDGYPLATGARFMSTDNPFGLRDNFRQQVIDASALLRAVALNGASGLSNGTVLLDPTKVAFLARSLGAIIGTLVLATDPLPSRAVLNVPGADLVDLFRNSVRYGKRWDAILAAQNITKGSFAERRLRTIFQWILDPSDPGNFGKYLTQDQLDDLTKPGSKVTKKEVMVQYAGKDQVIPTANTSFLIDQIGADTKQTFYKDQDHYFLNFAHPTGTQGATDAAQEQAVTFLSTGAICTPNFNALVGTCK